MIIYLLLGLLIVLAILIIISLKLCRIIVYPKLKSYDYTYEKEIKDNNLQDFYSSLTKEEVIIKSSFGYDLKGYFIPNKDSNKFIIICHGITSNSNASIKYASLFYKHNFNILIYDHRFHGHSGGKFASMGYFEKFDLKSWTDWLYKNKGDNIILGVFGESMGAGTVMQYCGIDNRAKFCIEDCGYSDVKKLFITRLKEDYKIYCPPLVSFTSLVMKIRYKWSFNKTSPVKYVKNLEIPMLFIHGDKDTYVPTAMVYELYNSKTKGFKQLYLCKGAKHAASFATDHEEYASIVNSFLKSIDLN